MGKALAWIVGIVIVLAAVAVGGRAFATRAMQLRSVTPQPLGAATPDSLGVPYARVAVVSGDRTLIGWWVRVEVDSGQSAPAVLFLHGNHSAISDYTTFLHFLYRQGISTFVFDYTGFGASGGKPSLEHAIADAGRVATVFADSAGPATRKVAFGTGLGATVLLQAIDSVQPHVQGIVIEGTDASVREAAVRVGKLPERLAPFVPDIADNVAAASRVRVPVLAVHSYSDDRVPIGDAERVVAAVPSRAVLVRHWRKGHSAIMNSTKPCDWEPVLNFIRTGTLPAAAVDTTNACEVPVPQLASDTAAAVTPSGNAGQSDSATVGTPRPASDTTAPTKTKVPVTKTRTPPTKTKAPPSKTKAPAVNQSRRAPPL